MKMFTHSMRPCREEPVSQVSIWVCVCGGGGGGGGMFEMLLPTTGAERLA